MEGRRRRLFATISSTPGLSHQLENGVNNQLWVLVRDVMTGPGGDDEAAVDRAYSSPKISFDMACQTDNWLISC
jgi:hypothetical protein